MTLVSIRRVHTFFVLQRCFGIGDSFTKLLLKNINIHDSRTFWRARPGWLTPTWSLFSHRRYKQVLSTCHLLGLFSLPSKLSASPLDMWGLPIISTVDRKHESSQRGKKNSCFSACQILQDGCAGRQFSSDLCQIWKNNKHTCTHRHSAGGGARWDQRPRAAREWCVQLTGPANSQFRRPNSTPEVPLLLAWSTLKLAMKHFPLDCKTYK